MSAARSTTPLRFDADTSAPLVDALGFRPIAAKLALAILDQANDSGFVIGLEGSWGSGKSTILDYTAAALGEAADRPEVVRFAPWLIGSRDALIEMLFADIARVAVRVPPKQIDRTVRIWPLPWPSAWASGRVRVPNWIPTQWARRIQYRARLRQSLSRFSALAGLLSHGAQAASLAGVPGAEVAKESLRRAQAATQNMISEPSLARRKSELRDLLTLLSRRIVVIVDDLDRLEPAEAAEMLRVVRSVADFPNLIYVLAYDRDVLAKALQTALQVERGAAYLEKFVQVSFRVPSVEPFDLRNWFRAQLHVLFKEDIPDESPALARLNAVVDIEGGEYLTTPREVIRALNALRLHFPPARGNIDLGDLVWLQLIRLKNPALYDFVDGYIQDQATVMMMDAYVQPPSSGERLRQLQQLFGDRLDVSLERLREFLPGISRNFAFKGEDEEDWSLHASVESDKRAALIDAKRLGSPHHYRNYFAFSYPSGSVSEKEAEDFLSRLDDAAISDASFSSFVARERPLGGSFAEPLLDFAIARPNHYVSDDSATNLAMCVANHMDAAYAKRARQLGAYGDVWSQGQRLLRVILTGRNEQSRASLLRRVFGEGNALGWLTALFRSETFAHGHFGDRKEDASQWLLTEPEYTLVLEVTLDRYRRLGANDSARLLETPKFVSLLHAWAQGAKNYSEVQQWVDAQMVDPDAMWRLLDLFKQSNSRDWFTLLTPATLKVRLEKIRDDQATEAEIADRARLFLGILAEQKEAGAAASD